ncbi:hypothetical protein EYR40_005949 [Pleurotus pulmonarius]|nr:hypothetical protein EYR40_005949 [Pleurotus pulmonarius]
MVNSKAFTTLASLGATFVVNVLAQQSSQDNDIWDKASPSSLPTSSLPSPLAGTDDYKGPILFNPGGPGGSGVQMIADGGAAFSELLGANFDIVSFDPRGVGLSIPRVSFFDTEAQRQFFGSFDVVNATSDGLARIWARAQITGALAARHNQHNILEHFNTENTARDMLKIVEAHGQRNIQYWGFSYGTVLGATFASLFPGRIDRLVLDGVVDAEDYYATLWSKNLLDADKTLQIFFDDCFEAGPDVCPFYEPSPQAISRKLDDLTRAIFLRPVPVVTDISYGLVDYARLRMSIFQSLWSPYAFFPQLAQGLADLINGNGTTLYQIMEQPLFDCSCGTPTPPTIIADGGIAISCTDGEEGHSWATLVTLYSGSETPQTQLHRLQGKDVLEIRDTVLLNVFPSSRARKMAQGFPGSVVLAQDSPGHCSIAAPSVCTAKFIRAYFMNGTLPNEGVVCPVDVPIFLEQSLGTRDHTMRRAVGVNLGGKDEDIVQAIAHLRESFRVPLPF